MQACGVCAVGKCEQQAPQNQATYDVQHHFQLVAADTVGPITPQAFGGFTCVTKFVDQQTKWKEIFIIKEKQQTVDTLELYKKALVIPTAQRLVCLKADKVTGAHECGSSPVLSRHRRQCQSMTVPTLLSTFERTSGQARRLLASHHVCSSVRVYQSSVGEC